jgi:teichuronic acid biosynthesis glycosyltransferase TuaC
VISSPIENITNTSLSLAICLYTTTALPRKGGQEIVVDALARAFTERGHRVFVLTPGARAQAKKADENLPYQVIRHPRFVSTRHFVSWYRWFLLSAFKKHPFNILHCHGVYPAGYVAALCRERLGIPLVITNHAGGLEEKLLRPTAPTILERSRYALGATDALVALSPWACETYGRLRPDAKNVWNIPNGVDVALFARPAARPDNLDPAIVPRRYLLFIGRLIRKKGADLLLDAFARLSADGSLVLVIAGSGAEWEALHSRVHELGQAERVRFVGWVTGDTRIYLLQNALCCVIPSRAPEAFGLVALESYAAGCPVVAARSAGLSHLVFEGRTGLLFEPDSVDSLVSILTRMLQDPARLAAMATESRQFAASYDWPLIAERHLALYRSLLTNRFLRQNNETTSSANGVCRADDHAPVAHP